MRGRSVRLSGGDEGIFVKQTTRRTSECINSIDDNLGDNGKGTGQVGLHCSSDRDYCSGVR
jgi:hypothetical protein